MSAVVTTNGTGNPSLGGGGIMGPGDGLPIDPTNPAGGDYSGLPIDPSGLHNPIPPGIIPTTRSCPEQIIGLVPFFPCTNDECREYGADALIDDHQFPLPVFASGDPDPYKNDTNSWLINLTPIWNGALNITGFYLDKQVSGLWVQQTSLWNSAYGITYETLCNLSNGIPSLNWKGFQISWQSVYLAFGEGIYRVRLASTIYRKVSCCATPPFCVKQFDCNAANRTVRFDVSYEGGTFGSVDKDCYVWSFCCCNTSEIGTTTCFPITWQDSIRFEGFFGGEEGQLERTKLKYVTGAVKNVRNEVIRKWQLRTGNLPKWLHKRLMKYAFNDEDTLYVNDYNINNPDYGLKAKWVKCSSGYKPEYKGYSRFFKVNVDFEDGCQKLIRQRCC